MPALNRPHSPRPMPQRYRTPSDRGTMAAGNTFRNAKIIDIVEAEAPAMDVVFDQQISLSGFPDWTWSGVVLQPTVELGQPQVLADGVTIRFPDVTPSGAMADVVITVPQNEPAVRTRTGGWVDEGDYSPAPEE